MKKLIKSIAFILMALCLFGCRSTNYPDEPRTYEIDLSDKITLATLNYNKWGAPYSMLQSQGFEITELFNGNLPKKGDILKIKWQGKSNKEIKNLNILIVDIKWREQPSDKDIWTHLISLEKQPTPVATNINADTKFEIDTELTLDASASHNIYVYFCCSEDDTEASNYIYNTNEKPNIPIILGRSLGAGSWNSEVFANKITWPKGTFDGGVCWDLTGIDLSEYNKVRIEIESNTATGLELGLCYKENSKDNDSWYIYYTPKEQNVWEADLAGELSEWKSENAVSIDKSKGLRIFLKNHTGEENPHETDQITVVKSIQLLK